MKVFNISMVFIICLLFLLCTRMINAEDDYDYKEEIAAPIKPIVPIRSSSLNRRNSNPRSIGKAPTSTTTAKSEPINDEEIQYDDEIEGEQGLDNESPVTTTTEATKKGGIRGGVRPFRSNDDLLAALKRRREQASNGKSQTKVVVNNDNVERNEPVPVANVPPKKSSLSSKQSGRKRYNSSRGQSSNNEDETAAQSAQIEVSSSPRSARGRFNLRSSRSQRQTVDNESQGSETSQQFTQTRAFRPRSRQ